MELFSPTIPELVEIEATEQEVRKNLGSRGPDLLDVYNHRTDCANCTMESYDNCPHILETYSLVRDNDGLRVDWELSDSCKKKPGHFKMQRTEFLMEELKLPKDVIDKTVRDYKENNESQREAKQQCINYFNNFLDHLSAGEGLLLSGPTGTGKTHLMAGLAKGIISQYQRQVKFIDVGVFCSDYMHGSRSFDEKKKDIDSMKNVDVLILDDLGSELEHDGGRKTKPIIMNIILQRYNSTKPTLFTTNFTNHSEPTLENYLGKRVFSRVRGKNLNVAVAGEDHRTQSVWGDITKPAKEEPIDA